MNILKLATPWLIAAGLTLAASTSMADSLTKSCSNARGPSVGATTKVKLNFQIRGRFRDIISAQVSHGDTDQLNFATVSYRVNRFGRFSTHGNGIRVPRRGAQNKNIRITQHNIFGTFTANVRHHFNGGISTCTIVF